jgi:hypothetical protein
MTLTYVEDYIEFLYGSLDKDGNNASVMYRAASTAHAIKLATYDKSPVSSMGAFCARARTEKLETCLTDKQVNLARTIIFKYRRQLQTIGIVLPECEAGIPLRHQIRSIDRTKYLKHDLENKQIHLKFPYDPKKISALHDYVPCSAGHAEWDNNKRIWTFDLTEGNIVKVLDLFKNEDLKIDESLTDIVTDVYKATPKDLPSLAISNSEMKVINAHPKVLEYFESLGWQSSQIDKLANWVSQAISLGLRIDESVIDALLSQYDSQIVNILINRKFTLPSNNQPVGPWYDSLLKTNELLQDYPWVLHLTWWTNKTDWAPFKNMIEYEEKDKNTFRVQKQFAELLQGLKDPIVVVDSVIGRDSVRNFIESNSLKVIYISDIGQP